MQESLTYYQRLSSEQGSVSTLVMALVLGGANNGTQSTKNARPPFRIQSKREGGKISFSPPQDCAAITEGSDDLQ